MRTEVQQKYNTVYAQMRLCYIYILQAWPDDIERGTLFFL